MKKINFSRVLTLILCSSIITASMNISELSIYVSADESYTSNIRSEPVYWLDMTKGDDLIFDGEILSLTFAIKEGVPDGCYPINIIDTDFVNWEEEQLDIKAIGGYVTVGNAEPTEQEQIQPGEFTISCTNASGNVGDQVTVSINLSNNPGLVGMVFFIEYDANALEFELFSRGDAFDNLYPVEVKDIDLDGIISISDASAVLDIYSKTAAGLTTDNYSEEQLSLADVDADGKISISDASLILSYYAKKAAGIK